MNRGYFSFLLSFAVLLHSASGKSAETVTHQYDELGRLIQTQKTGGPATGTQTTTVYDPAGNRSNYLTTGVPGQAPPPVNQPPVANADSGGTLARCSLKTVNVTGNDTDPEGNLPLQLVSVTSSQIAVTVASATSVQFESSNLTGVFSATYTVQDSLGATSTGTVTVTVSGGACQ